MRKALIAVHVALLALLTIYAGEQVFRWFVKLVNPVDESVKFWTPGFGMILVAISFTLLLAILACSTGIIKNPTWRLLGFLHGLWLVCLTWFGWSAGGPFTLQELVRIDLSDPAAVSRAQTNHLLQALAVYVVIVVASSIPLLMRWFDDHGRVDRMNPSGKAPNPALQHH
jgi:hypothetical protein